MPNRLIHALSPYLLQHAHNPVDWYPWGKEAWKKAKAEHKPIFLSIGYAACHWCHVMAHESFEDEAIADLLNRHFVNIKVDREEHPEVDEIYMHAVVALTDQGGWPLSVFLTPELKPFYGGTYFPPQRRYQLPSFREVLEAIIRLWRDERQRLQESSEQIYVYLRASQPNLESEQAFTPSSKMLDEAVLKLAQEFDWKHGGWGKAPKFPQAMLLDFLLRRAYRGDRLALDMAKRTLDAMAQGGMYDLLGGGFARYSTDETWTIPHFEKMLYDNALLARNYLHAYLLTQDQSYRRIAIETLEFMRRELASSERFEGFYSSLDADVDGVEGRYYVWTLAEIESVLDAAEAQAGRPTPLRWFDLFRQAFHHEGDVQFEGGILLKRKADDNQLAQRYGLPEHEIRAMLEEIQSALFAARRNRVMPLVDDKVLLFWNGLALGVFSEVAIFLGVNGYAQFAEEFTSFLLTQLYSEQGLLRVYRRGMAQHPASLADYASLALGLLHLYQCTFNPRWYQIARQLVDKAVRLFQRPEGGFFDTQAARDDLIIRPMQIQDLATPSGNSMMAMCLVVLSALSGNQEYRLLAEKSLALIQPYLDYPTAIGNWLSLMDMLAHPLYEVAILGDTSHPEFQRMLEIVRTRYRPDIVLAASPYPTDAEAPELLRQREPIDRQPTAYVCQQFVCHAPSRSASELQAMLQQPTNRPTEV